MTSPGNRHCANCIGALSFPIRQRDDLVHMCDWLQTQTSGPHCSRTPPTTNSSSRSTAGTATLE